MTTKKKPLTKRGWSLSPEVVEEHKRQGQYPLEVNAAYKSKNTDPRKKSINIYLTPEQAREFCQRLLTKASLIEDRDDSVVQIYNRSEKHTLEFGLASKVKSHRSPKR